MSFLLGFKIIREEGPPPHPHPPRPREAPASQVSGVREELQSVVVSQQTHEGEYRGTKRVGEIIKRGRGRREEWFKT